MAQTGLPAIANLGAAYTGATLGYRVLNLDRTTYAAFTTSGVTESPAGSGVYSVSGGVSAPDAGGYIVFGPAGTDLAEAPIPAAPLSPAAVWAYADRTLTGFGSLVTDMAAAVWAYATRTLTSGSVDISGIAESVWTWARRTLTSSATQTMGAVLGENISINRAVTFSATISGLNISPTWSKIYFTVKDFNQYADSAAIVQILKSNPSAGGDGLLRLNRAAATAAYGSLTVDQPGGAITITIADEGTADLYFGDHNYDLKAILADGTSVILTQGLAFVRLTSTHAV